MPSGIVDSRLTNKTEFMRYLNDHEGAIASTASLLKEYRTLHTRGDNFGVYLRNKHPLKFASLYSRWWLKHPELFDSVYSTTPTL